ncbi:tubulin-specific chaperone D [Teleopsis dalmanni]|uniref:tubulin-specific chaperone D n=1 Tax=Teleopsis dalmanni TaxID=139649 RepID=UPI0018CF8735|nr:tubulin-specific chaperone D [Teleopsis dalmanni]
MMMYEDSGEDVAPANTLEHFTEVDQVLEMINTMKSTVEVGFEKEFEKFNNVLSRYQEQPHLIDPHLEEMLKLLLGKIQCSGASTPVINAAFKYMYIICKVRTYKVLVKFLPHELSDLEFALNLLEQQDPTEFENWETRYMLLLWMSILVLNPFHMSRLDDFDTNVPSVNAAINPAEPNLLNSVQQKSKMERIYDLCKLYSASHDTCSSVCAYLAAKFLVRADIKELYLESFLDWVISENKTETVEVKYGQLSAVAAILKHGKREDLLPYADKLLHWLILCDYKSSSNFLKYKNYMKIMQRIGLVYLKPRVASWRYNRGTRLLVSNLNSSSKTTDEDHEHVSQNQCLDMDDDVYVPESVEEVIEELLQGLRSSSSAVRWNAAKGIGRVTNRLTKGMADEVIGSVIDILNPLEPHEAWHGACLALAELAKRGLLLPYRLTELVPLLMQALFYDEVKGYMSMGQHIRDSACYMCWAFARAYNPEDLAPFVQQISSGLLTVAAFDREVNCRRAASAAFQESVGRLGNFPHGIEISTCTDFFSVGLRHNTYLSVSFLIAKYEEYRKPLIDHLVERKVNHWDTAIRELTAEALHSLTFLAPEYVAAEILPKLFKLADSTDINARHGSILAIGEVTTTLRELEKSKNNPKTLITDETRIYLNQLLEKFLLRDSFRGMSGEIMKQCCTDFIRNCSAANLTITKTCLVSWQTVIDMCLINKSATIRDSAKRAFAKFTLAYYTLKEYEKINTDTIHAYIDLANEQVEESRRMGYLGALGVLPAYMVFNEVDLLLDCLIKNALPPPGVIPSWDITAQACTIPTAMWSEARRESIKALSNLVKTIGFVDDMKKCMIPSFGHQDRFDKVMDCFLKAMNEYTLDNRGDIGAWVRESAMTAMYELITSCPRHLLQAKHMHEIMVSLAQQAVEKIDRTRGIAGRIFCDIITTKPELPYILNHQRIKELLPEDLSKVLWLFADQTFPIFCSFLELPSYSKRILLGVCASIGQLTESLIKYSSNALFQYLRSHPEDVTRLCKEIVENFEENLLNERVTYPLLSFLDILIRSGTINSVFLDETSTFAEDIYRLVSVEIKGHKKLYKFIAGVCVYCQLLQVRSMTKKILSKLSLILGLTHVHIRKTTATKLYEALALYGENCEISEESLDEVLTLLSETDWGLPLVEVRPIRNEICVLLNIKPPTPGPTKPVASINHQANQAN